MSMCVDATPRYHRDVFVVCLNSVRRLAWLSLFEMVITYCSLPRRSEIGVVIATQTGLRSPSNNNLGAGREYRFMRERFVLLSRCHACFGVTKNQERRDIKASRVQEVRES